MAASFTADAGGLRATQSSGAALDYTLDWSESLDGGDAINTSDWTADAGLIVDRQSSEDTSTTAWLSGGLGGRSYRVTNTIITNTGRTDTRSFRVFIEDAAALGAGRPSVFPSLADAVARFRRDRLSGPAQAWLAGVELSDEYLLDKLVAAESYVEHRLRLFLYPREVLPSGATQAERDALDEAGTPWVEEPGYDHDPDVMMGRSWAMTDLMHRPVIAVHEFRFAYPGPSSTIFVVPKDWIRLDKKRGRLQLVPVQSAGMMSFSGVILSALNAGRTVPLAIQIRYRAGLENAQRDYPEILNLIFKLAVLDVLDDQFLPGSGSTSVDGLSQTMSWDSAAPRKALDDKLDAIRTSLSGIRLMTL
jgi:hypothetical protein